MAPCVLNGAPLGVSHPVLDLGEGLLNRVEVWGVRRQEPEPGAGRPDHCADGSRLVGTEIVHDDNVAGLERRHELLLDISPEALAVDRSVEDAWGRKFVAAQRPDEGQRAPVAVRSKAAQTLALRSPAVVRRHVGLDPCLINEDQSGRVKARLKGTPTSSPAGNVGAGLLKGEQCFF